jgi:two-component system response regulator PilR (NtrC family)
MGRSLLIVEDDPALAEGLSIFLEGSGLECATARDGPSALRLLAHARFDLLLCGVDSTLLRRMADDFPAVGIVTLEPGDGVVPNEGLLKRIRRILPFDSAASGADSGRPFPEAEPLIGRSAAMRSVIDLVSKLARSTGTVLITGESGTGKEVAARSLHESCEATRDQRFVAINCAAIPQTLMESELFGHSRGAFTGATAEKRGLMETAERGTLFLDEIGEVDLGLQAKLLRAIDRREITRVGGVAPIRLEARIVCATNRDLREQIARKLFREDLYYRIGVVEIRIPPLRERPEDIPELAAHFIARLNRELKRDFKGVEPAAMVAMKSHEWRGNVRELQNVIERAMILRDGKTIGLEDLPVHIARSTARSPQRLKDALRAYERDHIRAVLEEVGRNREMAARRLGIGVSSLYRKMRSLRLATGDPPPPEEGRKPRRSDIVY